MATSIVPAVTGSELVCCAHCVGKQCRPMKLSPKASNACHLSSSGFLPLRIRRGAPSGRPGGDPEFVNGSRKRRGARAGEGPAAVVQDRSQSDAFEAQKQERIKKAFDDVAAAFGLAGANFFSSLPQDLLVDLKDAGFALSSGPVKRECGEDVGSALLQLGTALEAGNADAAAGASLALSKAAVALPPGSSLRAALGKKLLASAQKFLSMGTFGSGQLQKIGNVLKQAGDEISEGSVLGPTPPPPEERKIFKFGSMQVELSQGSAFTGAGISLLFGLLSWRFAAGVSGPSDGTAADSLQGALTTLANGSTVLCLVSAVGLLALGVQLPPSGNDSKNRTP